LIPLFITGDRLLEGKEIKEV